MSRSDKMPTEFYVVVIDTETQSIARVALTTSKESATQHAVDMARRVENVELESINYVTVYKNGKAVHVYNLITKKQTPKHEKEVRK
jgi:hypothetical protein